MKKQVLFLSLLVAFIGTIFQANAQSRTTEIGDFVAAAKEAEDELAMLLPAVQKVREYAAFVPTIEAAIKLAKQVQRAGTSMTQRQYETFQNDLAKLEADLDQQTRQQKPPYTCHGKCEADFPGKGGGKGWKRFWCKVGCIKFGGFEGGNN